MAADHLIRHLEIMLWSVARLSMWLALFAAIFVPIERLFALHAQPVLRKGIATDVGFYFINALIPGLVLGPPISLAVLAIHRVMPGVVLTTIADWPIWLKACATMLVGEVAYYWAHRASHQIPLLWRFHAVHHSAEELDFLVNNRMHPIDMVWSRMIMLTPIFALGLANPLSYRDGLFATVVLATGSIWSYFIHSNIRWRLGPFEWLLTTPGFHHWHHTYGGKRRDCNYASMFPWLDRIFGTHYLPKEWPERYGIEEPMPHTLAGQFVQPFVPQSPLGAGAGRRRSGGAAQGRPNWSPRRGLTAPTLVVPQNGAALNAGPLARSVGLVHDAAMTATSTRPSPEWLDQIRPSMRDVASSGIVEVFNYGRGRQGLIPLWVGEGDLPTPPFISEAAKASLDRGETFYTYQRGVPELRAAIAAYMTRVYGARPGGGAFSPENFFVTIGGMHAIEIATRLIVGPGDEALIPSPAWPNFVGALEISGARAVPRPSRPDEPLEPRSGQARARSDPGDQAHLFQHARKPDRLRGHARGDRRDPRHRAPAWALDHRGRDLWPHHLRRRPRALVSRRDGA